MADRYYAMAETMNTRGAMEMAVPCDRQAITLLLAERASLQQKLGGASAQPVAQELPLDELHGLLEAAKALGQSASMPAPTATDVRAQAAPAAAMAPGPSITRESIEAQIAELATELGKENALQVIAGLKALADAAGGQLPARAWPCWAKPRCCWASLRMACRVLKRLWQLHPVMLSCRSTPVRLGWSMAMPKGHWP